MKKKLGLFALVLAAALFVNAGAQVTGKYLGFTADRFWDNNGVFSTDAAIQSTGASNTLKVKYDAANYATLAVSSTGVTTLDVTGTTGGFAVSDPLTVTGLFTHKYDAAAYWTATQADAGGVTFNSTSDGTPGFIFADPIDFTGITPVGTAGSLITTRTNWISFPTAGAAGIKLLLENTSDTGEFASIRIRGRANNTTASGNGGSSIGTTTAGDFSASAIDHEYGNLTAINACVQPNALNQTTDSSNIVTALYGRVDRTGTSVGRTWVGWLDTHQTTKSGAGDYLLRLSHNGTVANDGAITIYNGGRMPVLFNFEDAAGFLTDSDGSHSVASGAIAVKTPAGTKYIVLYN